MSAASLTTVALRAAALGVATGGRSSVGLAAVTATSRPEEQLAALPLRLLSAPRARLVGAAMLLGELVVDKLPQTPSRLMPPAFAGRIVTGGLLGGALAQRYRVSAVTPVVVGALAAAASSVAGLRWREAVVARGRPDLLGALAEDAVVLGLARYATAR